ncbi:MAG: SGNH/GDSL hydrolase family protein [Planctomycetota bacterium]
MALLIGGLGLSWFVLERPGFGGPPRRTFVDSSPLVPAWLQPAAAPLEPAARPALLPPLPARLWTLDSLGDPGLVADRASYFSRRPGHTARWTWDEHPAGGFQRTIGPLGLRADAPLPATRPSPWVLLTGDSHVDGICDDSELASERLSQALVESGRPRAAVSNAACAYYTLQNYLGVAARFARARPDVLVVVVYGGNDFGALVPLERELRGRSRPSRPRGYRIALLAAEAATAEGRPVADSVWQALNQVYSFARSPELVEPTLTLAWELTEAIRDTCEDHGVRLLVAYLPPAFEVQPDALHPAFGEACALLELGPADLRRSTELSSRYLDGLRARAIACVDVGPEFREAREPLYWRRDEHLNVAGQRLLAETLVAPLLALLEQP